MSNIKVTEITIGIDFGFEQDYGKGTKSHAHVKANYESGLYLEDSNFMIMDGLDLYFSAWQTLLAGKFATGQIGGAEYKSILEKATARVKKTREFLSNEQMETN